MILDRRRQQDIIEVLYNKVYSISNYFFLKQNKLNCISCHIETTTRLPDPADIQVNQHKRKKPPELTGGLNAQDPRGIGGLLLNGITG